MNPHEPTPEFRALLEREIARALRSEMSFPPAPSRTRRIGILRGVAEEYSPRVRADAIQ